MPEEEMRFFNPDESDHEEKKLKYTNYHITFRPRLFLEFFFYHLMFSIFGPFSVLIFYKVPGLILM